MTRENADPKAAIAEILATEDDHDTAGSLIASRLLDMDHELDGAEVETVVSGIIENHDDEDPQDLAQRIWDKLDEQFF